MTIWDWLEEITYKKSPTHSFCEQDWESFNSYMIHRFISMSPYYIELSNRLQTIPPTEKKQIYTIYKELIPKRKVFLKYVKGNISKYNTNLLELLSSHFECSKAEAKEYFNVLGKPQIRILLSKMGFEKKEITKLLKI
jgi:hypothetical protein